MKKTKLVIVGGGFGGVKIAHDLAGDARFEITLISERDYFCYYPSLYHSATTGLTRESIIPLEDIFGDTSVRVVHNKVTSLDKKEKKVICRNSTSYEYDYLVLALGVVTNYFGIEGLDKYSYGIKSKEEVEKFKAHVKAKIASKEKEDHNYLIVGGGPTGIELAGALPGYIRGLANQAGKEVKFKVTLIEAANRLMPRGSKSMSRSLKRRLNNLGVKVMTNAHVQGQDINHLTIDGKKVESTCVVWTAGMSNNPFFAENGFVMHNRHVAVNAYLEAEDGIYILGDNANTPYAGFAQTAMNDAKFVGENLVRKIEGKDPESYRVKKPVCVTPVGPRWAALQYGKIEMYGMMPWLLRRLADARAHVELEPILQSVEQSALSLRP